MCKKLDTYFDNYFVAVYDSEDNYITSFENIEETHNFFNIPLKEVLRKLREDSFILYKGVKVKLYLVRKSKEREKLI